MGVRKEEVIEFLSNMPVIDLAGLITELEEKWGVSAAAPVAVAAAGGTAAGGAAAEEKTEFDVVLTAAGDKRIQLIKEVRSLTSLGLKEAKELVEGVPKTIKKGLSKEEAEKMGESLTKVGATVEIK